MENTKHLACRRCHIRKIKCNRRQPCSNCMQGGHNCESRIHDARKRPVSHKYLHALEARLAYFECLVRELKEAPDGQRDDLLADVALDDHLEADIGPEASAAFDSLEIPNISQTVALHTGPDNTRQFHGPTSIYLGADVANLQTGKLNEISPDHSVNRSLAPSPDGFAMLRLASALGVDEGLIRETLPLFFMHQYPFCMFVYREAFLSDYYENTHAGRYWSYPLVYAMCALGAAHAKHASTRAKAALLGKCAREIIITYCLTRPSPTTIQALLCLAFHEIGQGSASQGWLFSGMAFRMGQDIGFHQDPSRWITQDHSLVTTEDIEVRRRIYWGTYLADKFMSLFLGRPVYLREIDAAVRITEPLPDLPNGHPWFGLTELASSAGLQRPQLTEALKHMLLLGNIFHDMMTDVLSESQNVQTSGSYRTNKLDTVNFRLGKWQASLPEGLQWSQWGSSKNVHAYTLVLHLYYHAMLLSLNRHFVRPSAGFPRSTASYEICASSVTTIAVLIRQFRTQDGLRTAPLMLVYALVMAIVTQLRMLDTGSEGILFLSKSLDECAQYYKIAAEARSRLKPLIDLSASTTNDREEPSTRNAEHKGTLQSSSFKKAPYDVGSCPTSTIPSDEQAINTERVAVPDPLLDFDPFDTNTFDDTDYGFHGWFSIGRIG